MADTVDDIVARFTKEILGLANKQGVEFDYAGNKGNKVAEIKRTMKINDKTVNKLLEPEPMYRSPVKKRRVL